MLRTCYAFPNQAFSRKARTPKGASLHFVSLASTNVEGDPNEMGGHLLFASAFFEKKAEVEGGLNGVNDHLLLAGSRRT